MIWIPYLRRLLRHTRLRNRRGLHRPDLKETRRGHGLGLEFLSSKKRSFRHVTEYFDSGRDPAIFADVHVMSDCGINAQEAIFPHVNLPGEHDMRRNERIVVDDAVMADMIAAPKSDVVADTDEGLHGIVLKDERMLAYLHIGPHERPGADVTG